MVNHYQLNSSDDIIIKTLEIQTEMEKIRREIWQDNGVNRTSLSDIDQDIYLNHTYQRNIKPLASHMTL